MKQQTKKTLTSLINGDDERQHFRIHYKNPVTGKTHLYGCWPPDPKLRPGDVIEVEADSPETAETFLRLRGIKS